MRLFLLLGGTILLPALTGCATTASPPGPAPALSPMGRVAELQRQGDHDGVIAYVERSSQRGIHPRDRARLELARARALQELDRTRSALGAYQRAWGLVRETRDALGVEILGEWADAEMLVGDHRNAIAHYERLIGSPSLSREREQRVMASLAVACEAAGQASTAERWRRSLDHGGEARIAAARRRLLPAPPPATVSVTPTWAVTRGPITGDPQDILPDIHRRVEWRALPIGSNHDPMLAVRRITVHHSAMDAPWTGSVTSHLQKIQDFHRTDRGWADIGYHFLVDPSGGVWEGRSLLYQGAHAGGAANIANVGVCVLGNFDQHPVPGSQMTSLLRLLDALRARFGVPLAEVSTHRSWKVTECPGRHLEAAMASYRRGAASTLALQ